MLLLVAIWYIKLKLLLFKKNKQTRIFFWNFLKFFILFLEVLKVRRPWRKTSGFRTVRILKICRTSGPDVMSGWDQNTKIDWFLWQIYPGRRRSTEKSLRIEICIKLSPKWGNRLFLWQIYHNKKIVFCWMTWIKNHKLRFCN